MGKLATNRLAGRSRVTTRPPTSSYMSTASGNSSKATTLPARPVLVAAVTWGMTDMDIR